MNRRMSPVHDNRPSHPPVCLFVIRYQRCGCGCGCLCVETRQPLQRLTAISLGMPRCPDCGASYDAHGDDCQVRFDTLLALDHSRREPWGSRHGLAFSAFALQHASRYDRDVLERAWTFLCAVFVRGDDRAAVGRALRAAGRDTPDWGLAPLPAAAPAPPFDMTITDLGAFDAHSYADQLDRWCRSTIAAWSAPAIR